MAQVDTNLLNRFHALEIEICSYENKHVEAQYNVSAEQLAKLEKQYHGLKNKYEKTHDELKKQERKEELYTHKGPNFKKFGARITGHLKEKQDAKKELVEELSKKDEQYKHDLEVLRSQVQSHKRKHMDLENDQAQLVTWRSEQEDILHRAFDGPSGSAEENAAEMQLSAIQEQKHVLAAQKSTYAQSRQYLAGGVKQMQGALQSLRAASTNNRLQLVGGLMDGPQRTPLMDIMEQRRIQQGKMLLEEAKQNLVNAKSLVPEIPRINDSDIHAFGLAADIVFGGAMMDFMQQQKLNKSMASVESTLESSIYALRWMDAVMAQQINPNLQAVEQSYFAQRDALKQIRYALIRGMIPGADQSAAVEHPPTYAPVSSAASFDAPTCWTTANVTPEETKKRELANSDSFNIFGHDSGSEHEVHKWLNNLSPGLGDLYGPALIEYGYDSIVALKAASDEEFDEALDGLEVNGETVKVKKPHQRLIKTGHDQMRG